MRAQLGRYQILERIARGGMAEIYRAKTSGIAGFEKIQALKRILPASAREPRFIRSFIDEARIAVELNHRNIVQVFDFGKADGELFLAMELIDGVDLRTALDEAAAAGLVLPVPLACYIAGEIAAGLDYAHRKADDGGRSLGIVHCDVSPPNVMLSYEGYVKILDFGVARARFGARPGKRLRGKPRYMAPEQTHGQTPTPATDVFALAVVAWEMLAGRPLFDGPDLQTVLAAVRAAEIPPLERENTAVPHELATLLARALSVAPERRGTAADLATGLLGAARGLEPGIGSRSLSAWLARLRPSHAPPSVPPAAPVSEPASGSPTMPLRVRAAPTGAVVRALAEQPTATASTAAQAPFAAPDSLPAASDAPTASGSPSAATTAARFVPGAPSSELAFEPTQAGSGELRREAVPIAAADEPAQRFLAPSATETSHTRPLATPARDPDAAELDPDARARIAALLDRRQVVVLAAVVDAAAALSHELLRLLGDMAYKRGAVVYDERAGSVVVVFGLERVSEDDVGAAMAYALDAVELGRETARHTGAAALVRIAARAGVSAHRRAGDRYRLVGDAAAETRRLAREAAPARPLLAGHAGRSSATYFDLRPRADRRPGRRARVHELWGRRSFDERARALLVRRGRFLGRDGELDRLAAVLERARAEARRYVALIEGRAGVGKSRLVAELVARAGDEPALVAVAAQPGAAATPFALLTELCQASLNLPPDRGRAARARLARRLRHVLERSEPAVEADDAVAAVELACELRDGAIVSAEHARRDLRGRLVAALTAFRRARVAAGRPLITILEDLHAADPASLDVLRASLGADADGAELVLLTARSTPADALLAAGDLALAVRLSELDGIDARALVADRVGPHADDGVIETICARAGGNPLWLEELSAAVGAGPEARVPASVRDLICARVDRLPASHKAVLQHAAVIGPSLSEQVLIELCGPDAGPAIEALCAEGLLARAEHPGSRERVGQLGFARALVREVVYETLSPRARRETHALIGSLLAARRRTGTDESPAVIASHFERGEHPATAAGFWRIAGDAALAAHDARDAIDAYGRALALDDDASREPVRLRRIAVLLGRERALGLIGDHDAQRRDLDTLTVLVADEPALAADVANRRARLALRMGDYDGARAASERAERAADAAGDAVARGRALLVRAEVHERTAEFAVAVELAGRARDVFAASDAYADETEALIGIARAHLVRGDFALARAAYGPVARRVEQSGDPWLERVVYNHLAVVHTAVGELQDAMDAARRAVALCQRLGDRAREGDNLSVCGMILAELGQYHEADTSFARALEILRSTDSRWSLADCLSYAGACRARLGDADGALAMVDEAAEHARALGARYVEAGALGARARILLDRGAPADIARAARDAADATAAARDATVTGLEIQALSRHAEACFRADDAEGALELSTLAIALLDEHPHIEGSEEEVLYTHWRLLAAAGRPDAPAVLARARASLDRKLAAIREPRWRASFQAIPLHAAILTATKPT